MQRSLAHLVKLAVAASSLFLSAFSNANVAGGWTPLVTNEVQTGTETYKGRTDRFLDNGILRVLFAENGNVDSIKYLKPGLAGTPKDDGIEMVSQSGVNFGNHTAIYYYFFPDSNGDATYLSTSESNGNVTISFRRTFNPSKHNVVADIELHYMLGVGNSGLYSYMVIRHPTSYAQYGDLNISFIQCLWPTAHDDTNFLLENSYVDDDAVYGLQIDGEYQKRNGLQPSFYDTVHKIEGPFGLPREVIQYTTGPFAGSINSKYSYTFDYQKLDTFGMASDVNKLGIWFVAGGHEYQNNGPTANEYSGGIEGILSFEPIIAHYGNSGLSVPAEAEFTKVYGPWLMYFNGEDSGAEAWADSKLQAEAEKAAWPYAWMTNPAYQTMDERATVSGQLVITDTLRPQANAAGAWVGLAAPDSGIENDPDNWQFQSDGYQFWTQADEEGNFTLPPVATKTPYGETASYQLYAYCAGPNGSVGEFQTGPYTFSPDQTVDLGTLTWKVPHQGDSIAWEIGYPDRTAAEFRHGNDYSVPGLWLNFANEFPNPMTYTIGESEPTDWNYAQTTYLVDGVDNNMVWHIEFDLLELPTNNGNAILNTIWAGANNAAIQVFVNDPDMVNPRFRDFYPNVRGGANSVLRQGIHDKYGIDRTEIPLNLLREGTNTITLVQRRSSSNGPAAYVMYDYLSLELPDFGTEPPLDSGVSSTWSGGQNSNTWDLSTTSNFQVDGSASTFGNGDAVTFSNSGNNESSVLLVGELVPNSVNFEGDKNYTLAGTGRLIGQMALTKTGDSELSILGAHDYAGGTLLKQGTITLLSDDANQSGLGLGSISHSGGTLQLYDNNQSYNSFPYNLNVPAGASAKLYADSRCDFTGRLTGSGTLEFTTPWVRTTMHGDWSSFSGMLNVRSDSDGGEFRIQNSFGLPQATVDLGDLVTMHYTSSPAENGTTIELGSLSGSQSSVLSGSATGGRLLTWRIGTNDTDSVFNGTIRDQSPATITALVKAGNGTWTVNGDIDDNGPVLVEAGALTLNGNTSAPSLTVADGAILGGVGPIDSLVQIVSGGELQVSTQQANTVRFTNGLSITASTIAFEQGANATIEGDLHIDGSIALKTLGSSAHPSGDYTILSYTGNITGTPTFHWADSGQVATVDLSQSGAIIVSIANYISDWRNENFGTEENAGIAANDADPDRDSLPNLIEYALGLNPNSYSKSAIELVNPSYQTRKIVFRRITDPKLKYEVLASTDLIVWQPIWVSEGIENADGLVTVLDPSPHSENAPSRFLRLKVSLPGQ